MQPRWPAGVARPSCRPNPWPQPWSGWGWGDSRKTPPVCLAIQELLQSMDGFPALVSDPWLNGRLTALHACSDLWACGAHVSSAMATITLPMVSANEQQELLVQTLAGIRSVLDEQGAELIGGHTMESRSASPVPASLGVQITLTVNGNSPQSPWLKSGLQPGDALLISRPLGTGVLFAGAMTGATKAADLDAALKGMACSQHTLLEQIEPIREGHSRLHRHHRFRPARASGRDAPEQPRPHRRAGRFCHPGLPRCT